MKSIGIAIIIITLIAPNLYAQKISFGPEIGVNIINMDQNSVDGNLYNLGFNGGGYFEYKLTKHFSVRAKLIYTSKRKAFYTKSSASIDTTFFSELSDFAIDTSFTNLLED